MHFFYSFTISSEIEGNVIAVKFHSNRTVAGFTNYSEISIKRQFAPNLGPGVLWHMILKIYNPKFWWGTLGNKVRAKNGKFCGKFRGNLLIKWWKKLKIIENQLLLYESLFPYILTICTWISRPKFKTLDFGVIAGNSEKRISVRQ